MNSLHQLPCVLILMNKMAYESTSPGEALRFAKYYQKKGLEVLVVLLGPMGVILAKSGKKGLIPYDRMIKECLDRGIRFKCCNTACNMIGLDRKEIIDGIEMVSSEDVAELILKYKEDGHLVISL